MIKTAPHSTLSPQMWCLKKNKRMVCTHPDLLARICKLVERKKFGLICFPRLIYCDQEPLLLLNLTVHLFGCTYKAISTRYKICFTPKSLNFSMGASLLAVAKSLYYGCSLIASSPFGGVARSHTRAAHKRTRKCKWRGKRGRIFFLVQYRYSQFLLAPWF